MGDHGHTGTIRAAMDGVIEAAGNLAGWVFAVGVVLAVVAEQLTTRR